MARTTAKIKITNKRIRSAKFLEAVKKGGKKHMAVPKGTGGKNMRHMLPHIVWGRKTMTMAQMEAYNFLVFREPLACGTVNPDGSETKGVSSIPVEDKGKLIGRLPLQNDYEQAWVDLCYMIVYCKEMARIANNMIGGPKAMANYLTRVRDAALTRLRYYIRVRKLIMVEIEERWSDPHNLKTFKEYIVKERFDYHFLTPAEFNAAEYRNLDPMDKNSHAIMDLPDNQIHPNMLPPGNDWRWVEGSLPHLNLEMTLKRDAKMVLSSKGPTKVMPEFIIGDVYDDENDDSWKDNNFRFYSQEDMIEYLSGSERSGIEDSDHIRRSPTAGPSNPRPPSPVNPGPSNTQPPPPVNPGASNPVDPKNPAPGEDNNENSGQTDPNTIKKNLLAKRNKAMEAINQNAT